MATITVLDAVRMLAIEAASVVNGHVDGGTGHLLLTTHDGTVIDAGYVWGTVVQASSSLSGIVELATSAETASGVDNARAVTPAGLKPSLDGLDTRLDTLEAAPGAKVQTLFPLPAENALPTAYPLGISLASAGSGSGWSLAGGFGSIITTRAGVTDRCVQEFFTIDGGTGHPTGWYRTYNTTGGGGGWTAWEQRVRTRDLVVTQSPNMIVATGTFSDSADLVFSASGPGVSISITFPAGRFSTIPKVVVCPTKSSRITVAAVSITTTGFTAQLDNFSGFTATDRDFNWIAMKE